MASIYLDDCIQQRRLVRQLRAAGHSVHLPSELGVEGQSDEDHLARASTGYKRRYRRASAARVGALRMPAGLSQEALVAGAGLDRAHVRSVERGERNIGLDNNHALDEALGVGVRELFRPP